MRALALWCALLGASIACTPSIPRVAPRAAPPADALPEVRTHTSRNRETGVVVRRWTVLTRAGARSVKHGLEERFWSDGAPRARREYREGAPVGEWRTWHRDGSPESEVAFPGTGERTISSFWHPSGQLSARGPAIEGVREGEWTYWYEDGTPRQRGSYAAGRKVGEWSLWHRSGGLRSRGTYLDDARVGPWRHWPEWPAVGEGEAQSHEAQSHEIQSHEIRTEETGADEVQPDDGADDDAPRSQ